MASFSWTRWLRSFFRPQGKTTRRPSRRLGVEPLESRVTPTITFTWTGLGGPAQKDWSNPNNWTNSLGPTLIAPTGDPASLDDLVFPVTALQRTTNNNLVPPPSNPLFTAVTFNSITISGSNYTLGGKPLTLGVPTQKSGFVNVSNNDTSELISLDVTLGGPPGSDQFFTINPGADLTISGRISGTTLSSLTKEQTGQLILTADNSGFTGPVQLGNTAGIVTITNAKALGDTTSPTTVGTNSQLQVKDLGPGNPVMEQLLLNGPGTGPGITDPGDLLNVSGTNVWKGNIQLDINGPFVTLGSAANSLDIQGQISDLGAGQSLVKEGVGQVILSHAGGNTYRGTTTINNGILTIRDSLALGAPLNGNPSAANGTIVNQTPTEVGTLQLDANGGPDLEIKDEPLTLNGMGVNGLTVTQKLIDPNTGLPFIDFNTGLPFTNIGALTSRQGNNTWAGNITLGSPFPNGRNVWIGAITGASLTISGVIGDVAAPSGPFTLTKVDAGTVIFNNANTYAGTTDIEMAALNIRDSNALGSNLPVATGVVIVQNNAALELQVDTGIEKAHGRDLAIDSVTGQNGNGPQLGLTVTKSLILHGSGINNTGALHSLSGINVWAGTIATNNAAIGVEADPNQSNTNTYFTHDYSLTVSGPPAPVVPAITNGIALATGNLTKVGPGQLILPVANSYLGTTTIQQGWITVENNQSLGGFILGIGDTAQRLTTVVAGAALHVKAPSATIAAAPGGAIAVDRIAPLTGSTVTITTTAPHAFSVGEMIVVSGVGVAGYNGTFAVTSVPTSTTFTYFNPMTGLAASGGGGVLAPSLNIVENLVLAGNGIAHPFPLINQKGALMNLGGTNTIGGPNNNRSSDIFLNGVAGIGVEQLGPNPTSELALTAAVADFNGITGGGISKYGSQRLDLQGFGSYTGTVTVSEGVLRAQNNTALGTATTGTAGGIETYTATTTSVGPGIAEAQSLTVSGALGNFQLMFTDAQGKTDTTVPLPSNVTATALQNALNALTNIGGGVRFVAVNLVGNIYTITFLGNLAGTNLAPLVALTDPGVNVTVATLLDGNGSALDLQSSVPTNNGGIATGLGIWNEHLFLNSPGTSEVQKLTPGGLLGSFTLTFTDPAGNSATTGTLGAASPTLAADIQTALNGLATIGGEGGSVLVSQTGNVYTVTFSGTLAGRNLLALVATPSAGTTVAVAAVVAGEAPLTALSSDNLWHGPVTLVSNSTVQVKPNARLTLFGTIDDISTQALTQVGASDMQTLGLSALSGMFALAFNGQSTMPLDASSAFLADDVQTALNNLSTIKNVGGSVTVTQSGTVLTITFAGTLGGFSQPLLVFTGVSGGLTGSVSANSGELALAGTNTYRGTTFVNQGILLLENSLALGSPGVQEVQTLTLAGSSGTFTLTFNGQTTGPLDVTSPTLAADVQNALNALPSIGGVGGSVTVSSPTGGIVLTVTFIGSLTGFNQPTLVATPTAGLTVTVGTLVDGAGGTTVANGASIELEGSLSIAGEPLRLQGQGAAATSTVPAGWFNIGPAPINNGQTQGNEAVAGRVTGVAVDPSDTKVIYIATAGGGAWKTRNGGLTWEQLFDSSPVQRLYVPSTSGMIMLTFNAATTGPLDLAAPTLATDIQNALNGLSTIGGLSPLAGRVTVTRSTTNPLVFTIAFGGALSATQPLLITGLGVGTTASPTITDVTPVLYTGAIAVDPHDPRIIYLGTGEANNAADSFYGTGVYQSKDSGKTWTLLTTADGFNPLFGLAVTKIVVDPGPFDNIIGGFKNTTATGTIYVATSNQVTNAPVTATPPTPGVYRYTESLSYTQVQTLTVPNLNGGTFTLSFKGSTTGPIALTTPPSVASQIQTALNSATFASIGGSGGSVVVTFSTINPLVYSIAFEGSLLAQPFPPGFPVKGTNFSTQTSLPLNPPLLTATGSGLAVPDPVVSPGTPWVNLTGTTTFGRLTLSGQTGALPVGTRGPGPDDDFRIGFPQASATWSDLTLAYFDNTTPPTGTPPSPGFPGRPGQTFSVPVLYASLGIGTGNINNAVFRTENPNFAPAKNIATAWNIGDPGVPLDEIESITIAPPAGGPFQLTFNGFNTIPLSGSISAAALKAALDSLASIGGIGGGVIVTLISSNVVQNVFNVEFIGSLANSPQNPFTVIGASPKVTIGQVQAGAGFDTRTAGEFPAGPFFAFPPRNGNIKITVFVAPNPLSTPFFPLNPTFNQVTLYAAVTVPDLPFPGGFPNTHGQLLEIDKSTDGGKTWAPVTLPPNYMANQGQYDSTISIIPDAAKDANQVIVGGHESPAGSHLNQLYMTSDGGTTWNPISLSVSGTNGPHTSQHALAVVIDPTTGQSISVIAGNDGGVSRFDLGGASWTDINGNLAITQFNGAAVDPTNLSSAFGSSRFNGVEAFTGSQAWKQDDISSTTFNDAGVVHVDPQNPSNVYYVQSNSPLELPVLGALSSNLRASSDGGTTWKTILTLPPPNTIPLLSARYFPFVLDSINTSRLVVGGVSLFGGAGSVSLLESLAGVASTPADFKSLNAPLATVSALALATFQGNFVLDSIPVLPIGSPPTGFPQVKDRLSNTYDPDTIYITNGTNIRVTKNRGVSWNVPAAGDVRDIPDLLNPGFSLSSINDLEVDPRNRDTVFAVRNTFDSSGRKVFVSTNAAANAGPNAGLGKSWTDITFNLPDLPVWKLVIDPRTGDVYIGDDAGVYQLQGTALNAFLASLQPGGPPLLNPPVWQRFGSGLANVQVKDLVLNLTTNTLTAGTYGRSMYQLFLEPPPPGTVPIVGALRAVSGSSVWTGPVQLVGDATHPVGIGANGTQALQNGLAAAQLNILGTISDASAGNNAKLVKVGEGDVILSGTNTYSGVTDIAEGQLVVHNTRALGLSVEVQKVTVTGTTGTFTLNFKGQITSQLNAGDPNLAANMQTALNALPTIGGAGGFVTVTQSGSVFTVIFGGTLAVGDQPQLTAAIASGTVVVSVGTDRNGGGNTVVEDGAALALQSDLELEPVTLNGDGILFNNHYQGALRNVSNFNTYTGTITLGQPTGGAPPPTANAITVGVDSGTSLTIGTKPGILLGTGTITDAGTTKSLIKELSGTLILASANNIGGLVEVNQGALQIQHAGALGGTGKGTDVFDGAQLQLQTPTVGPLANQPVVVVGEPLTLSGTGIFNTGALLDTGGSNAWNGPITLVRNAVELLPAASPLTFMTNPGTTIAIGTANVGDTLTIGGPIDENKSDFTIGLFFGLTKVGVGRVTLATSDSTLDATLVPYAGVTTVVAGALRIQDAGALGDPGQGTVVQAGGALELDSAPSSLGTFAVAGEALSINGSGVPQVQTVTVTGAFNLTFNGQTTGALPIGAPASSVQQALNTLSSIGGIGGSVMVTQSGNVYTILFGGALAQVTGAQPQLTAAGVGGGSAVVATVQAGGLGALRNVTGSNVWGGSITLLNDPTVALNPTLASNFAAIGVDPATRLTAQGVIQDPSEIQVVTVTGASGTFTLTFKGQTTDPTAHLLDVTSASLAADIQSALNALSSIGGAGGSVTVTQGTGVSPKVFTVTFGGSLAQSNQPQITATAGAGLAVVTTTQREGPASPAPAADLYKFGTGTLVFQNANTYGGTTNVNSGILNIQHSQALGTSLGLPIVPTSPPSPAPPLGEEQTITVTGASGTFTLTFGGKTTGTLDIQHPPAQLATEIEAALNGLSSINSIGAVKVTPGTGTSSNVFTVDFIGNLSFLDQPQLTSGGTPGVSAAVATVRDGSKGTVVQSGATLQVQNNITVLTESLTLNGTGFNNAGALENVSGNNAFSGPPNLPITLASNVSVNVDGAGDLLTISQAIGESAPGGFGVTKIGPGTLLYDQGTPTSANTYTGLTQVNEGTLKLNKSGAPAFRGNLTIGDALGGPATVQWLSANQVPDTAAVFVQRDGTLDLNGQTDTIGPLTITDGVALTGAGQLTVASLTMTGGTFNTNAVGKLILNGDVVATSDATGTATITGSGMVSLNGATRTFTVADGPQAVDLRVTSGAVIAGIGAEGLTKAGPGRMEIDSASAYTGLTTIAAGDLQVDGKVGNVALTGGTLSGKGGTGTQQVGTITGAPPTTPAVGTVNPGDNGSAVLSGILHSSTVLWGSGTTFFVNLNDSSPPNPIAGLDYDQLFVNGDITLGGATLTGLAGPSVQLGDKFTIIQTSGGTVKGTFAPAAVVFLGPSKFTIDYSDPTKVVLTKVIANATVATTPSLPSPSPYGADVMFTATLTPETGATVPPSGTVTFTLGGTLSLTSNPILLVNGMATFDPATDALGGMPLPLGTYTIDVSYIGDANFGPANAPQITQAVQQAPTTVTITTSPTSPGYGQPVIVTAAVAPVTATLPGATAISGTVTFTIDNVVQSPPSTLIGRQASISLPPLAVGTKHTVIAVYSGDGNYQGSGSSSNPPFTFTVGKNNAVPLPAASPTAGAFGQGVVFSVTIPSAPNGAAPTGTVTFYDGAILAANMLGQTTALSGGSATLPAISMLATGTHQIFVTYSGDGNYAATNNSASPLAFVVSADATSTVLSTPAATAAIGQTVTFTAIVTNTTSGTSTAPVGTVTFTIDGTVPPGGMVNVSPGTTAGTATAAFSTSSLPKGPHTIVATFNGSANFAASLASNTVTVTILSGANVGISTPTNPSTFGQSVTYTVNVTAAGGASGTPTGTVTLLVDGSLVGGTTQTLSSGQATITVSTIPGGAHQVSARYSGDALFAQADASPPVMQTVIAASTSTTVGSTATTSIFGATVTLTAAVANTSNLPMPPTPNSGKVTFLDVFNGSSTSLGQGDLNGSGVASLPVNNLSVGTHTIKAHFEGTANFSPSDSMNVVTVTVNPAATSTSIISDRNPAVFGQAVNFIATVTAISSPGTPAGTVTFTVDSLAPFSRPLDGTGNAVLSLSNLSAGGHTVTASYDGNGNFTGSPGNTVNQTILQAATSTMVSSSLNPASFGQTVNFVATVTSTTPATPDGTVTFTVDNVPQSPSVTLDASGHATLSLNNLSLGGHTVTASYDGNTNFTGSSGNTVTETIKQAGTSTALSSSANPSIVGQPVTFIATITSFAVPDGTVTFTVDGVTQPKATLNGGKATLTVATFTLGAHTVTAGYDGNANFAASGPTALTQQVLNASATSIASSANPSVFGQPVVFTATIVAATGSGTPTGTVTFVVDNTARAPVSVNSSGQASITLNNLIVGSHTVTANYSGDGTFAPSSPTVPVTQTVNTVATTLTLTASSDTVSTGQPVTLTVKVTAANPSTAIPTGSVVFVVDGITQPPVPLNADGVATLTLNGLAMGGHTVTASYPGGGGFQASPPLTNPVRVSVINFQGSPIQVWVNQFYLDVLGRPVDPTGLAFWSDKLEADISSNPIAARAAVAQQIEASDEFRTNLILKLYKELLGRTPDLNDLNFQLNFLRGGGTIERLKADFLSSPEYFLRGGRMDFGVYTEAVYEYVLGHAADTMAQQFWISYLQSHTRTDMALSIATSPEAYGLFVRLQYQTLLHRLPEGGTAPNPWFVALTQGARDEAVTAGIASSDEYFTRLVPEHNTQQQDIRWLGHIYQDMLGRNIDVAGQNFWSNNLEHGFGHLNVTFLIANSGEFRTHEINQTYQKLLRRPADALGLSDALGRLGSGGTLEQVKAIIMGSPEYFFGHSGTPASFLNSVYQDALGRTVDQAGLTFWGQRLAMGESRTDVALEILTGIDGLEAVVQSYYLQTLKRSADPVGQAYFAGLIQSGIPDELVVANLVATKEYYVKNSNS